MDYTAGTIAQAAVLAHDLYARANDTKNGTHTDSSTSSSSDRPPVYKVIGISLAVGSGAFIGTSFVLKKVGLLKANEKYNEVAGEGYGYLKNAYWWSGMTLMILGEICNFVAYAFTDAILVTPLGALSVVITTILSAIFLKERLSMVGKVACFLCIIGSVVIVMNAPQESSVGTIQDMQRFVVTPGFLSYAGVILVGSAVTAFYVGPRWGKKNMLVYLSICSWVGGLSVVATQGLGSAIVAQVGGTPQFNQWFLYVLLVFVVGTLLTEIIFLNKALNLFNAAMVTPTYYVYFTSTTIITSAVLFQGFKGTVTSIVTVVMGFLVICSGVVLLQLSKSAKDVPDTAVFAGNLDQIHTIAEQEQPETEPKADAIRGAAAIVRRISTARQNMEVAELKRLHEEKIRERLEAVSETAGESSNYPLYEWDGLRRRPTTLNSQRSRPFTASSPTVPSNRAGPFTPAPTTPHPPLGWSHMPTEEEIAAADRPFTPGVLSSISGTIRGHARSILVPAQHQLGSGDIHEPLTEMVPGGATADFPGDKIQSPMHPVQLTEISVPTQHNEDRYSEFDGRQQFRASSYNLPVSKTEYSGVAEYALEAPCPPPHSARRQFSFQNMFRRHQHHDDRTTADEALLHSDPAIQSSPSEYRRPPVVSSRGYSIPQVKGSTEEERLGLVKRDSRSGTILTTYDEEDEPDDKQIFYNEDDENTYTDDRRPGTTSTVDTQRYGRGITGSVGGSGSPSPPRGGRSHSQSSTDYGPQGRRTSQYQTQYETPSPLPPPRDHRHSPPRGGDGAFI